MHLENKTFNPNEILLKANNHLELGNYEDATNLYHELLSFFPKHPESLSGLGLVALKKGDLIESTSYLEQSLAILPNQPSALSNYAIALTNLNRLNQALIVFGILKLLYPDNPENYYNCGITLKLLGRTNDAILNYDKAIELNPNFINAYINRASALKELKQLEAALHDYNLALTINSNFEETLNNRGNLLIELGRFDEAISDYRKAIKSNPNFAEAYNNLGRAYHTLKKNNEAIQSYQQAIFIKPEFSQAHYNLANLFHENHSLEAAEKSFKKAIEFHPESFEAHTNIGLVYEALGKFEKALASYNKAISLNPSSPIAYWNKALLKILLGEFEEGWELFEWRWEGSVQKGTKRNFYKPLWLGKESLTGKTLLIHAEQGLGDVIQFCRYALMAEKVSQHIILELPKSLMALISSLKGHFTFIEVGQPCPPYDFHCPIMSLPLAFKTTISTIPAPIPYIFTDEVKEKIWQKRLASKTKPRIGLVCSGSITHPNDWNRSIALLQLNRLFELPVEFHLLQKEIRESDTIQVKNLSNLTAHLDDLEDLSDTAALINQMDIIITVDTAIAHLAGAMGKKVWILLPYVPDYRWLLNRVDTPWYPNARLFRQASIGDWSSTVDSVYEELQKFIININ